MLVFKGWLSRKECFHVVEQRSFRDVTYAPVADASSPDGLPAPKPAQGHPIIPNTARRSAVPAFVAFWKALTAITAA